MSDATVEAELPSPRYTIDKSQWSILSKSIETRLRILCFRRPKPAEDELRELLFAAIGHPVSEDDRYYEKGMSKCLSNIATWQNKALDTMLEWMKEELVNDQDERFSSQSDPKALFRYFSRNFDSKDADGVFSHASAKWILFMGPNAKGSQARASRWTKDYFANLATMAKLHLDDPRAEKYDRDAMIWFYQNWFLDGNGEDLPAYAGIRVSDFPPKRNRRLTTKRKKFVFRNTAFGQSATEANDEEEETLTGDV